MVASVNVMGARQCKAVVSLVLVSTNATVFGPGIPRIRMSTGLSGLPWVIGSPLESCTINIVLGQILSFVSNKKLELAKDTVRRDTPTHEAPTQLVLV